MCKEEKKPKNKEFGQKDQMRQDYYEDQGCCGQIKLWETLILTRIG